MSERDVLKEMDDYYRDRVLYHDELMNYMDNATMEELLRPIIEMIEDDITDRTVLELGCGTGNWTQVLAERARHVLATDLHEGYLVEARKKLEGVDNVELMLTDACTLDGVEGKFDVAFLADLWSHIPRQRINNLVVNLHSRLSPGSPVIVLDFLKAPVFEEWFDHIDENGNEVQRRTLPNGREYLMIKNFPTMEQLIADLEGHATGIKYIEHEGLKRWLLRYTVKWWGPGSR